MVYQRGEKPFAPLKCKVTCDIRLSKENQNRIITEEYNFTETNTQ